jgi:LytS/YehU family sensor histidine kinase
MATSTQTEARFSLGRLINRSGALLRWVVGLFADTLTLNLAATIFVLILQFWAPGRVTWRALLLSLCTTFIFSACIGNLIGLAIGLVGPYLSAERSARNLLQLTLLIATAAALGCVLASALVIAFGLYPPGDFFVIVSGSLKISVLIGLIFGLSSFFYEKLKAELEATQLQLRTRQLEEERARKLALAAQLASLESRLRPHLLFNTLNSISALIREDPGRAERMIERLAALLRFSLDSSERNTVPLGDEAKIVRDYLEIERVRFGERLRFKLEIPDELLQLEVPPFCLQTLVENSVKYAVSVKRAGAEIRVKAEAHQSSAKLTVSDDGPGFGAEAISSGHGLDTLQARLATLYGERAALDIRRAEHGTEVIVSLPRHTQ